MGDVNMRLILYQQLADCQTRDDILTLKEEMIDRFGKLPDSTQLLLDISVLKFRIKTMGIQKIDAGKQFIYFNFDAKPNINTQALIQLIQQHSTLYNLQANNRLRYRLPEESTDGAAKDFKTIAKQKMTYIEWVLEKLTII